MRAVKISDTVYWVGAIDWKIRDFHGYSTHQGTTYNAYLILAEKITLIDTVKKEYQEELLARISSLIPPDKIDYIVSNHSELDHSGCLPEMVSIIKPEKVFASSMGSKNLADHFHQSMDITVVRHGETLSLGNRSLLFLETKMLHWPDSMFSYLVEDHVLFSQDAFGMHIAGSERFADLANPDLVYYESAKYFANILLPYAPLITRLLDSVTRERIPIEIIAHDHGPIYRKDISSVLALYEKWSAQIPTRKAVIAYDTMWGSTALMARWIGEGLADAGIQIRQMPLTGCHRSDVATELLCSGALIAGSPTLNNHLYPTMADLMIYLKGLRPQHLVGAVFGSYGWGGEAIGQLRDHLTAMNITPQGEVKTKFVPNADVLNRCYELGMAVGTHLKSTVP